MRKQHLRKNNFSHKFSHKLNYLKIKFRHKLDSFKNNDFFRMSIPANHRRLFRKLIHSKQALSYLLHYLAAVFIISLAVFMLAYSSYSWAKTVGDSFRPMQLVFNGLNRVAAVSSGALAAITDPIKKTLGDIGSSLKKSFNQQLGIEQAPDASLVTPRPVSSTANSPSKNKIASSTEAAAAVKKTPTATTTASKTKYPYNPAVPIYSAPAPPPPPEPIIPPIVLPVTSILTSPPASTESTVANFTFASSKAAARYEYKLDNAAWITTTNSLTLSGLSASVHNLKVRSFDADGNTDASPAEYNWQITLFIPPASAPPLAMTIDTKPTPFSNSSSTLFVFSANQTPVNFLCTVDGGAEQVCAASFALAQLAEGNHSISVVAINGADTKSPAVTWDWFVDSLAPDVLLDDLPTSSKKTIYDSSGLTLTYVGDDHGTSSASGIDGYFIEYKIDDGEWTSWDDYADTLEITAIFTQPLVAGQVVAFRARAYDVVGNDGPWSTEQQTTITGTAANYVVISQVQITGTTPTDEFVELYNPTANPIDLSNYSLNGITSTGTDYEILNNFLDTIIEPYSYILVAYDDTGEAAVSPDRTYSGTNSIEPNHTVVLSDGATVIDQLGFGNADEYETNAYPDNPPVGQSLERKALATSTPLTMGLNGEHDLLGNSYDTDDNAEDFIMTTEAVRQNSDSDPEQLSLANIFGLRFAWARPFSILADAFGYLVDTWLKGVGMKNISQYFFDGANDFKTRVYGASRGKFFG